MLAINCVDNHATRQQPGSKHVTKHGTRPQEGTRAKATARQPIKDKAEAITNPTQKLEDDWPESIFPQALIQPRRHLLKSLRRACLRAAMLSVYGHMRAPSHRPTFLSNCAARILTKVVCASCIVPGCCAQVALCKLLHAAARKCSVQAALRKCSEQVALRKCSAPVAPCKRFAHVLCASWSVQVALRQLLRASALRMCSVQVALRKCSEQVALRKCSAPVAPRKRFAHVLCASWSVQVALRKCFVQLLCASCSAQVALRKLLCASDSAQVALRKCCRSCGTVLRVLFLYLKVAIFQPELRGCAPRTTFVHTSCEFPA